MGSIARLILGVFLALAIFTSCRERVDAPTAAGGNASSASIISHSSGLRIERTDTGVILLTVATPWPGAEKAFTYALVPKTILPYTSLNKDAYNAIVTIPVERVVAASTTHIPALEALGVIDRLVGFPETDFISSEKARQRIAEGQVQDLGSNEAINTEMVLELQPDVVFGFGISQQNKAYELLQRTGIPVVYNGDWTESTPLGKAEWIKFFAPFFGLEQKADSIFGRVESDYLKAKELAKQADRSPAVLSGALYKDVWYLPGGDSWAAQFLEDANCRYLWSDTNGKGSLSLSVESVLERASEADAWVSPSQYTTYEQMQEANPHYEQIRAFREKQVFTFAKTRGETGGFLYYELGPMRPDLVLKDLVHLLHPGLLPDHTPFFFKPLD